jgi:predicted RNA methylase
MNANKLKNIHEVMDEDFDLIFPLEIRRKSATHFTPIKIAKAAAEFLATEPGIRILDVGSGAGKFCIVGALLTKAHFTGVEQRKSLSDCANEIANKFELENVSFLNANMNRVKFSDFGAFYLFNPFFENLSPESAIDQKVFLDDELYLEYSDYVQKQLSTMPIGTRVVTYHSSGPEIPNTYKLKDSLFKTHLKFWIKQS